ncbi:MAG: zf-TFIIB domain-containing protein [Acidobacteria bacterium]|nr:zf-TFIIB domain-containing protein [Acidobacteriota bacterium]
MKCPACTDTDLVMTERQNIEIDYCPKCRGVWLDRGELDKIIERSVDQPGAGGRPADSYAGSPPTGGHHGGYGKHGYRRTSWFSRLFD